jgi:RNA polymerase-binding transcription factor DksA
MALTQQHIEQLHKKLLEEQKKLHSVMESFVVSDPVNDTDRLDDNADVGTDARESEELVRHESLERETKIMIDKTEAALKRIKEGTYGKTADGREIPYERLLVDPTADTLVE